MKILISLLSFLLMNNVFAHGENKYGPHNGYIKMPGSFHTELLQNKDGSFLVYLLDLQNKNPAVKDSSVELRIIDAEKNEDFNCMAMGEHFHCLSNNKTFTKGKIILKAKRLGIQGQEADYNLPLKLKTLNEGHDMKNMN